MSQLAPPSYALPGNDLIRDPDNGPTSSV